MGENATRDIRAANRRQIIVGVVAFAVLVGGIVTGLMPSKEQAPQNLRSAQLTPGATATIREDSVTLPNCEDRTIVQAVEGLLTRQSSAKVIGLSGVGSDASPGGDNRVCRASVNLDFGVQHVEYTIRRLGRSKTSWELQASVS